MPSDESLLDCWSGPNKALINMIVVVCFLKRHTRACVWRDCRSSAKNEAPKVHDGGSGLQRKRPVINASESTASQPASQRVQEMPAWLITMREKVLMQIFRLHLLQSFGTEFLE